jgi:hypothetical protein
MKPTILVNHPTTIQIEQNVQLATIRNTKLNTINTCDARGLCSKSYNLSPSVAEHNLTILPLAGLNQNNQETVDI